jgi:hypothetical protein
VGKIHGLGERNTRLGRKKTTTISGKNTTVNGKNTTDISGKFSEMLKIPSWRFCLLKPWLPTEAEWWAWCPFIASGHFIGHVLLPTLLWKVEMFQATCIASHWPCPKPSYEKKGRTFVQRFLR